jgi:tRNA threonylcarbamoyladenosine biosynthesis protein TsaE
MSLPHETPSPAIDLPSEEHTNALGRAIALCLSPGTLVVLDGNLGAGKTFLTGAIVRELGLDPEEPVTSPTYNLVSEYDLKFRVLHADLYRLSSEHEVFELGLEERRTQGGVLIVEWGRPYIDVLGGDAVVVELKTDPRRAEIVATGPNSRTARERILLRIDEFPFDKPRVDNSSQ